MEPRPGDEDDLFQEAAFPQDLGPPQEFENESSDSEDEFPKELLGKDLGFDEADSGDLGEEEGDCVPGPNDVPAREPLAPLEPVNAAVVETCDRQEEVLEPKETSGPKETGDSQEPEDCPGPSKPADSGSMGNFIREGKFFAGGRVGSPQRGACLDDLSEDLLIKIFSMADLSVRELCTYSTVCRKFKRVCYGANLWERVTLGREVNNCTLHKIAKRCSSLTELRIEKVQKIHGLRSVFRACGQSLKKLKISWESNSGSGFAFLVRNSLCFFPPNSHGRFAYRHTLSMPACFF